MSVAEPVRRPTPEELLQAASRLDTTELELLAAGVLALQANRRAPSAGDEGELLRTIGQPTPSGLQQRYDRLIRQRQCEALTTDEHEELLRLTDEVEELDVRRVEALAELARRRGRPLPELIEQMGLQGLQVRQDRGARPRYTRPCAAVPSAP